MKRWTHEVDPRWLKARQSVLTATDVSNLVPEYKRYLKAGSPDRIMPGFAALWGVKNYKGELDTESPSPAAARGHIMEPWAVESWNKQTGPVMYHWDDCIITNGLLGFSPDAMTTPQFVSGAPRFDYSGINPKAIMEIKCYGVENHMKSIIEDKMNHKELMQVAMAFAVLPNLETAYLTYFCPDAPISMYVEEYTADDLHDQCRWIVEIGEVYLKQAKLCEKLPRKFKAQCTEKEVWDAFVADLAAENVNSTFVLKG